MILAAALWRLAPTSQRGPADRLTAFFRDHRDVRCQFTVISGGKKVGSGWIAMHRESNGPSQPYDLPKGLQMAFEIKTASTWCKYVRNGEVTLEYYPRDHLYDRLTLPFDPLPQARRYGGFLTYPSDMIQGFLDRSWITQNSFASRRPDGSWGVSTSLTTADGVSVREIRFAPDGALLLEQARNENGPWFGFKFSHYKYTRAPKQPFAVAPPIGWHQYGFDPGSLPLSPGTKIPTMELIANPAGFNEHDMAGAPKALVIAVAEPVPEGLREAADEAAKSMKVVYLVTKPLTQLPFRQQLVLPDRELDRWGISAFPQMYVVAHGVIQREWQGFWPGGKAEFLKLALTPVEEKTPASAKAEPGKRL